MLRLLLLRLLLRLLHRMPLKLLVQRFSRALLLLWRRHVDARFAVPLLFHLDRLIARLLRSAGALQGVARHQLNEAGVRGVSRRRSGCSWGVGVGSFC